MVAFKLVKQTIFWQNKYFSSIFETLRCRGGRRNMAQWFSFLKNISSTTAWTKIVIFRRTNMRSSVPGVPMYSYVFTSSMNKIGINVLYLSGTIVELYTQNLWPCNQSTSSCVNDAGISSKHMPSISNHPRWWSTSLNYGDWKRPCVTSTFGIPRRLQIY